MPTSLAITECNNSPTDKKLLVIVSMQGVSSKTAKQQKQAGAEEKNRSGAAKNEDAYISVLEFDLLNNFRPKELHLIKSARP